MSRNLKSKIQNLKSQGAGGQGDQVNPSMITLNDATVESLPIIVAEFNCIRGLCADFASLKATSSSSTQRFSLCVTSLRTQHQQPTQRFH
jgi:hypothetical protein